MPTVPPTNAQLLAIVNAGHVASYRGINLYTAGSVPSDAQIQADFSGDVIQSGAGLLFSAKTIQNGDTVANTAAETLLATNCVLPAGVLHTGQTIRMMAYGLLSTSGTPTLQIKTKLGGTVILDTGAFTTGSGVAAKGWQYECIFTVLSIGSGGTVEVHGHASFNSGVATANFVNLANAAPITIDMTVAQTLQQSVTWGTANAGNTITRRILTVETLG